MTSMSRARFPARRDDGSFAVAAEFLAPGVVPERVRARLDDSIALRSARDHLPFDTEFAARPEVSGRGDAIWVEFRGRPGATLWKDWLVALSRDLEESGDGLRLVGFHDLVSGSAHPSWPLSG